MDRQAYINWIREVRGKMSQEEFGKKICHFKNDKGTKVCKPYHRNEIANWEKGKNVPLNLETFISIALLDFDNNHRDKSGSGYRNLRFQYVRNKMKVILGQELYCRIVHEALLIQVCRDIITFEELLELEPELDRIVQSVDMDMCQKRDYALQRGTENIAGNLYGVTKKDEIISIIAESKMFFYTGVRTFGERMRKCCEKEQRYTASIKFAEAVRVYAPNYRDSFGRVFTSSGISRRWIIDLCIHLRFNRAEIQDMLKNAKVIPLSADPCDVEFYYEEREGMAIGSASWYQYMEKQYPDKFKSHFSGLQLLDLSDKMRVAGLIGIFIGNVKHIEELVPVDYLLESFMWYDCGKEALKIMREINGHEKSAEELEMLIRDKGKFWIDYLESGLYTLESEDARKVYRDYLQEFSEYYMVPIKVDGQACNDIEAVKLRYFASIIYTVFTGHYYKGRIREEDLKIIKNQFENQVEGWKVIYGFINQFLVTFLSGRILHKDDKARYYCMINHKKKNTFDMEDVKESIWESIYMLDCTK